MLEPETDLLLYVQEVLTILDSKLQNKIGQDLLDIQ